MRRTIRGLRECGCLASQPRPRPRAVTTVISQSSGTGICSSLLPTAFSFELPPSIRALDGTFTVGFNRTNSVICCTGRPASQRFLDASFKVRYGKLRFFNSYASQSPSALDGGRYGPGPCGRREGQAVQALLHHQAAGSGHGPGLVGLAEHRGSAPRVDSRGGRARCGSDLHHPSA